MTSATPTHHHQHRHARPPMWQWGLMLVIVAVTAVIVLVVLDRWTSVRHHQPIAVSRGASANQLNDDVTTVRARITSGDVTVERSLPTAAFALRPGQSLDDRVPATSRGEGGEGGEGGAKTTALLTVPFAAGKVTAAHIGAEIRNGQLIVMRHGSVLHSTAAGDEPQLALTTLPVSLAGGMETIEYEFTWTGDKPTRFRPVWRPEGGDSILPLPARGGRLLGDETLRGMSLVQQMNCAACHVPEDSHLAEILAANRAPNLANVGARLREDWMRRWVLDPKSVQPESNMPALLRGPDQSALVEPLLAYLTSPRSQRTPAIASFDADMIATGRILYHDVGCVTCHGPREKLEDLPGGRATTHSTWKQYRTLDGVDEKYLPAALAEYLLDPLAAHPSGAMPDMRLTDIEARSLAAYLLADSPLSVPVADELAPTHHATIAIEQGRAAFADLGCAQCHTDTSLQSPAAFAQTPLERLTNLEGGCLADQPGGRAADYALHPFERDSIIAFLRSLDSRRSLDVPIDELALTLHRLDCTACHAYHAEFGPENAILSYFTSATEADLGDEGRLPPALTDVGWRLNQSWMHTMLAEAGISRPYLAVRMPQFGDENVRDLPRLLAAAAGIDDGPADVKGGEPPFSVEAAAVGRELAGASAFNCIQCHNVAGHRATGTPGPDLALAAERLRYDAFATWLLDPPRMRPGTRMPAFFYGGFSTIRDYDDGRAKAQIDAMWAYVSQGEQLPLPEGIETAAGLTLDVMDEPLVFRTFMKDAGVRAIACGFPEQVHGAFDADRCEVTLAWQGRFLDAGGAWANRGGTETNPEAVQWKLGMTHTLEVLGREAGERRAVFKGYRLDESRRPVFMYAVRSGDGEVVVQEHLYARVEGAMRSLMQRIEVTGAAGTRVQIELAGRALVESTPTAVRMDEDTYIVTIGEAGQASMTLEVHW